MKRIAVLIFSIGIACFASFLSAHDVSAEDDKSTDSKVNSQETSTTEASTVEADIPHSELMKGVWNEGKAVFSDVKALDLFWKHARGYKPKQPVKFSHRIHVEKNKMECQYCHSGVAKAPFATIPSMESCMGCHLRVKTDSPEIKKIKELWDQQKVVEWVPVNNLPEHVNFNHERHLKAGVGCQTCHGQIQKMDEVEKVSGLKMGWCLSCHRENGASIDCAVCHK